MLEGDFDFKVARQDYYLSKQQQAEKTVVVCSRLTQCVYRCCERSLSSRHATASCWKPSIPKRRHWCTAVLAASADDMYLLVAGTAARYRVCDYLRHEKLPG